MPKFKPLHLEFTQLHNWQRSKKGNLWRHHDGQTLTVFKRLDNLFSWCISGSDGPDFSEGTYETEEDALLALAEELGEA